MRIVVTGGRDFNDIGAIDMALDAVRRKHGDFTLINGCARGADTLCRQWASDRGLPCDDFPADWNKYGKGAGHIRNQKMIDEGKPDALVAFKGGRGTADMVRRCKSVGMPVWEV